LRCLRPAPANHGTCSSGKALAPTNGSTSPSAQHYHRVHSRMQAITAERSEVAGEQRVPAVVIRSPLQKRTSRRKVSFTATRHPKRNAIRSADSLIGISSIDSSSYTECVDAGSQAPSILAVMAVVDAFSSGALSVPCASAPAMAACLQTSRNGVGIRAAIARSWQRPLAQLRRGWDSLGPVPPARRRPVWHKSSGRLVRSIDAVCCAS
jgi:hypothetical protein